MHAIVESHQEMKELEKLVLLEYLRGILKNFLSNLGN